MSTPTPGVVTPPTTAEEAIALLERAADDRSEYLHPNDTVEGFDARMACDVGLSVDMLRAAADIIRTGDVRGWVPSWKWHLYGAPQQSGEPRGGS